jgi:hypothetical protein
MYVGYEEDPHTFSSEGCLLQSTNQEGMTVVGRRLLPVWFGIIALSAVFCGGEEAARPPTGTFGLADVQNVSISGTEGAYAFAVTVSSPDTGCNQYADWWELLTPEGELLFRHIVKHSHVNEQPFTRSGGPYPIQSQQTVIVRAHMSNLGYGGAAMRGSVESGFEPAPDITEGFAPEVETQAPLPRFCLY